jgi:hypothetical protein
MTLFQRLKMHGEYRADYARESPISGTTAKVREVLHCGKGYATLDLLEEKNYAPTDVYRLCSRGCLGAAARWILYR